MQFLLGHILHPNLYNLNIYGINVLNKTLNKCKSLLGIKIIYVSNNLSINSVEELS